MTSLLHKRGLILSALLGLVSSGLPAVSFGSGKPANLPSYHTLKSGVVSLQSGNSWKVLSANPAAIASTKSEWLSNATARHDFSNEAWLKAEGKAATDWQWDGCRGLLGDGWHIPSQLDWETDFETLQSSPLVEQLGDLNFWLSDYDTVKTWTGTEVSTYYSGNLKVKKTNAISVKNAGLLPTVCVCGPSVTENDYRRSKSQCGKFERDSAWEKVPSEVVVVTKPNTGAPVKQSYFKTAVDCLAKKMRVPRIDDLARLEGTLSEKFQGEGCTWSSTPSGDKRMPREIWKYRGVYPHAVTGDSGVGIASENYECYSVCVL